MTSVRHQLDRIIILVIAVVVALITLAFFLVEVISFRQIIVQTAVPQAETIAINIRTSLALREAPRAQEILATLAADSSIEGAYLFSKTTEPFAFYLPPRKRGEKTLHKHPVLIDKELILPILQTKTRITHFSPGYLSVFVPVVHNDETIGTVYLVRSLGPFYLRLLWWFLAAGVATAIAIAAGIALARRLQQTISQPIIDLAGKMALVTQDQDLSVRADIPTGASEFSTLASGFNAMLEGLNERDHRLATINEGLEARIAERTRELSALLQEKELLLREVHHRVKNNLQIISSLLSLQIKKVSDPAAIDALKTSLSRTRSISLIHEKLYSGTGQSPMNNLGEYLAALAQEIFRLHHISQQRIELRLDLAEVYLDFDRLINLALILNELLTNTFKHAFRADQSGIVTIRLRQEEERVVLSVRDNGLGLPDKFVIDLSPTVGLRLTDNLVRQAKGRFNLVRAEQGTEAIVVYPLGN